MEDSNDEKFCEYIFYMGDRGGVPSGGRICRNMGGAFLTGKVSFSNSAGVGKGDVLLSGASVGLHKTSDCKKCNVSERVSHSSNRDGSIISPETFGFFKLNQTNFALNSYNCTPIFSSSGIFVILTVHIPSFFCVTKHNDYEKSFAVDATFISSSKLQ